MNAPHQGVELGADDYIIAPFQPEPLIARLNAITRRCSGDTAEHAVHHWMTFCRCRAASKRISASRNELIQRKQVAAALMTKNSPLPRQTLYQGACSAMSHLWIEVWTHGNLQEVRPSPDQGNRIRSVRGLGYALVHALASKSSSQRRSRPNAQIPIEGHSPLAADVRPDHHAASLALHGSNRSKCEFDQHRHPDIASDVQHLSTTVIWDLYKPRSRINDPAIASLFAIYRLTPCLTADDHAAQGLDVGTSNGLRAPTH